MLEFAGTVKFVETHDFVRTEKESPTGEGYHEFKNGETHFLLGNAFGEAMLKLLKSGHVTTYALPAKLVKRLLDDLKPKSNSAAK